MGEFDRALILTSPTIKGKVVKDAQYLLSGKNTFVDDELGTIHPYKGKIDGVCGPSTMTAAREGKYWCGYPESELYESFGQTLYEILDGIRELPKDYHTRRAERVAASHLTRGHKALNVALTQIGYHEDPYGSNDQKYGIWYGFNGVAWCDIFVSWCFAQIGYKEFRYSYVPTTVHDALYNRNGMTLVTAPQAGDLCCYHTGEGDDMHIAFFHSVINKTQFYDVGGNTGPSNMSNGGAVLKQVRSYSQISHIIRIK